ncbi:MAG: Ig-like domain-containing protein [Bacteroidales bacterium]|nr:Ig-like domain-containing protein [Bacteroidales bacterium]
MKSLHTLALLLTTLGLLWACGPTQEDTPLEAPSVETTKVFNIGTTGFSYICRILNEGSGDITACGIVYATQPQPTLQTARSTNLLAPPTDLTLPTEHRVEGLDINQKYYVRAYATNPAGTSYGATREVYLQRSVEGLNILPESLELEEEQTFVLKLKFTPDNPQNARVTWSCTPSDVGTINDEGEITALKAGTATITAHSQDRDVQATCHLTVKKKVIPVASLHLLPQLTLHLGESQTLAYEVLPAEATERTVLWSSSNESVVQVKDGRVSARAEGQVTITLSTPDGKHTATCHIIVLPRRIAVSGIDLDSKSKTLPLGAAFQLKATIRPANADNKVLKWTSSHPTVASVDQQGRVQALKVGKTTITVTTLDGQHQASCQVQVQEATGESPTFVEMKKKIDAFQAEFQADKKDIEKAIADKNRDDMDYYYGQLHDYYQPLLMQLAQEASKRKKEMTAQELQLLQEALNLINHEINQLLAKCQ